MRVLEETRRRFRFGVLGFVVYEYDTESNLVGITDALQRTTSFSYNIDNRLTKVTFPSGLEETYEYYADRLSATVNRKTQRITYTYDHFDRLTWKTADTAINYDYDLANRMIKVVDGANQYDFAYDRIGRLIETKVKYDFLSHTFTTSYTYDAAGNRLTMADPFGVTTTYAYDALNRLTTLTDPQTNAFTFDYDSLSRRTKLTRPNGVVTDYTYDNLSRLLTILHKLNGQILDGATYTVDNAGNRTAKFNHLNNVQENYEYDQIYQLTRVLQTASGGTPTVSEEYSYDAVGNRARRKPIRTVQLRRCKSDECTSGACACPFSTAQVGNGEREKPCRRSRFTRCIAAFDNLSGKT